MIDLSEIKGIGINTLRYLNDLGINNLDDLVTYYPFRYDVYEKTDMDKIKNGDHVVIDGICENNPNVFHFSRKLNKMSFRFNTGKKIYNVTIFNRAYLKNKIKPGMALTIIGKYDTKHRGIVANNLEFGMLLKTKITPVYHSNFKITSKKIHQIITSVVDKVKVTDYVPETFNQKYNLIEKNKALKIIHNPSSLELLEKAKQKLKYEELFVFMLKMSYLKQGHKKNTGLERNVNFDKVKEKMENLPFKLTSDQEKAVKNIYDDLISSRQMNRLLQGDVGSGKTIVSFFALFINYLSGYQGALMAPTEILALQHYNNIKKVFPELKVGLLKGKLKVKERREILAGLADGTIDVVIGTHALISDDVVYQNLGLVITDEQHRFGVMQRGNLKNKGQMPDILYMSATPIPRTYALTLYGDMDISSIKTMPNGRKPVKTLLKSNKEIKDVLYLMLDEIKKNHQIYVVAPLVEESDKIDLENVYELADKMNKAFGKVCDIGVLHGKMSNKEKDEVMTKFKEGKTKILISTTVIEVGVDVANATMMVIFDSFRFGLSALHQLRGRVGRNDLDSYCVLISDRETKRLQILTETNDGFKISEEDFKLRGSGDLFGLRQSGDMHFKIADIKQDFNLLLTVKEDCENYLKELEASKAVILQDILQTTNNLD